MSARTVRRTCAPPGQAITTARIEAEAVWVRSAVSGATLGLLVDDRLVATGVVRSGSVRLDLKPGVLGSVADVIDAANGSSVLAAPLDLQAARPVEWLGWALQDGQIRGSFRLRGSHGPVLVAILDSERTLARCVATSAPNGTYAFAAAPSHLLSPGDERALRPLVAGVPVPAPALALTAQALGWTGHVDGVDDGGVHGWAASLVDPAHRVSVELRAGGELLAVAKATAPRPDVVAFGIGRRCGFRIPLPPGLDRFVEQRLHLCVTGTGLELANSPVLLPALPSHAGYFDGMEGPLVSGWAIDLRDPGTPPVIEVVCDGEVLCSEPSKLYRDDVLRAGMPTGWCGLRLLIDRPLLSLYGRNISLRVKETGTILPGSPRHIAPNHNIVRFLGRSRAIPQPVLARLTRRLSHQAAAAPVSIVMPIYNTEREWLYQAVNSVLNQWSAHWELICVDDASTAPHVVELLDTAERHDPRIRVIRAPQNGGIAATVNLGLRVARGALVMVLDHDDVLEPDAVHKLATAAIRTGADLVYADEAITSPDIDGVIHVVAHPAFSYDQYLSHPYFVHPVCVRTELARRVGGWDAGLPISADVDYVLRVVEAARSVAHVPAVLYRWRTHGGSAGHRMKDAVTQATLGALQRHLDRGGTGATARPGSSFNFYRIDWPDDDGPVLVVIPTKDRVDLLRPCIENLERTCAGVNYRIVVIDHASKDRATLAYLRRIAGRHTVMTYQGPFNYARMNNLAVKRHGRDAKYLLFLNNDVDAREPGWLPRLRSLCARPDVGAVGPLLLYDDARVQHAGVIIAFNKYADHAMRFQPAFAGDTTKRTVGYNGMLISVRDFSAVTAACMLVRRDAFRQVGGFDEKFAIAFNDTDLCLRIRRAGFKVLYDGLTTLTHHESATRAVQRALQHPEDNARLLKNWAPMFRDGDPFYSPLLTLDGADHQLRADAGCKGTARPRVVQLRPDCSPRAREHP